MPSRQLTPLILTFVRESGSSFGKRDVDYVFVGQSKSSKLSWHLMPTIGSFLNFTRAGNSHYFRSLDTGLRHGSGDSIWFFERKLLMPSCIFKFLLSFDVVKPLHKPRFLFVNGAPFGIMSEPLGIGLLCVFVQESHTLRSGID